MATATKNSKATTSATSVNSVENTAEVKTETKKEVKKEKRKYEQSEGILCKSITSGGLYMPGLKSNILYTWIDSGDQIEVEYQDLLAAIRSNNSYVMRPFLVIEDEEFVSQFPQLKKLYDKLYSVGELKDVITDLSPADMKATILSLPQGAQDSIKHIASKMVSDGTLDSVRKIKILDEIFDTEMSVMTGLFD